MNQIVNFHGHDASICLSTTSGAEEEARAALRAAQHLARKGNREEARAVCAEMIARQQPLLARQPALLSETIATLAFAHGFGAISRLLRAVRGRQASIRVVPHGQATPPPDDRRGAVAQIALSEAALGDLAALEAWASAL